MMEQRDTGFFKYLWRFNALAIAATTTLAILLGLYLAVSLLASGVRPQRATNVVNASNDDKVLNEFSLGRPHLIDGTPYVRVPLHRGQRSSPSSLSSTSGSQREVNYLFLNTSTYESRWLFDGTGQLIADVTVMFNRLTRLPDQAKTGIGIIYTIVEKDTDGDGVLTDKDAVSLAASDVDGGNFRKLAQGIDSLQSLQQIADDKVLVIYQKGKETVLEVYGLPAMTLLRQSNVPKIKLN